MFVSPQMDHTALLYFGIVIAEHADTDPYSDET